MFFHSRQQPDNPGRKQEEGVLCPLFWEEYWSSFHCDLCASGRWSVQRCELWVSSFGVFSSFWAMAAPGPRCGRRIGRCVLGLQSGSFALASVMRVVPVGHRGNRSLPGRLGLLWSWRGRGTGRRRRGDAGHSVQHWRGDGLRLGLRAGAGEERRSSGRLQKAFSTLGTLEEGEKEEQEDRKRWEIKEENRTKARKW